MSDRVHIRPGLPSDATVSRDRPFIDILDRFPPEVIADPDWQPPTSLPGILAVRARDHLMFGISWSDGVELSKRGAPKLTAPSQGYLILTFAPQNLAERAYYQRIHGPGDSGKDTEVNPAYDQASTPNEKPTRPVTDGQETPQPPPIQHRLSEESRLVFLVPEGTTIPFTIDGILEAVGKLELSVPANAKPREHEFFGVFVPESWMVGDLILARGEQDDFERLMTAGRIRERVRAPGPLVAATSDAYRDLLSSNLLVVVGRRASNSVRGEAVIEARGPVTDAMIDEFRLLRPKPALPGANQTAIEAPYRLIVSPSRLGGWAHSNQVVERQGRAELWHTRLGVRDAEDPEAVEVSESSTFQRVIRAVWARESFGLEDYQNTPDAFPQGNNPFRSSLDERDRHNLVHLSSNFGIVENKKRFTPQPVEVNRLMLTALGAWMDFEGRWNPWPKRLSVEEWLHRATLGRDHYVKVVYQGFLVPFGHRASLIKVTERLFASDVPGKNWGQRGNPAYMIQRMFIVVREPEKTYAGAGTFEGGKKLANSFPFTSVRLIDKETPDLDKPESSEVPGKGQTAFWPTIAGEPFQFRIAATDIEGNQLEFEAPLLFVDKQIDDTPADLSYVLNHQKGSPLSTIPIRGQQVAYAPGKSVEDTTFETASMTFAGVTATGTGSSRPGFQPVLTKASIAVPAIRHLTGTAELLTVSYADVFAKNGFTPGAGVNRGEVLFSTVPKSLDLSSKRDRTGGLATPSMKIGGISRLLGPVAGDLEKLRTGDFDPVAFFLGATSAYLFGVLPLAEVIKKADYVNDLAKAPRFVSQRLDRIEAFLDDMSRLRKLIVAQPALWNLVKTEIDAVAAAIQTMFAGGTANVTLALGQLNGKLEQLGLALPGPLPMGMQGEVIALVDRLRSIADQAAELVGLIEQLLKGVELPRSMSSRFEWRADLNAWPTSKPIFKPQTDLVLSVEARGSVKDGGDLTVSAALGKFDLDLVAPVASFLVLHFEKIQMLVRDGRKPEIDVVLSEIEFVGVLSFVETLKELIPLDAFSDPPAVQVDASGVRADLSVGLPNVSVGVFSLENLSLGAGFVVPFVGDPLSVYFRFCERENPALLSVSLFAGGFFFGITLNPKGIMILEAAIEFGANVSMDFGVASGGVSVMAGLYFKMESDKATLAGYFRVRGHVRALGIVTVSIELYLEMSYETSSGKCVGRAKLSISIELFMFETTISISCEKKFAGSGSDPTFLEAMGPYHLDPGDPTSPLVEPWEEYCVAFA